MMRFECRVVDCDIEGYYYPRWDKATPVTVDAATRQDAINQACAVMGECRRGRYWGVRVISVGPIPSGGAA